MSTIDSRGVVSVKEVWEERDGGIDEFGNRYYTRCWNVVTNEHWCGPLQITSSGALPQLFTRYESYDNLGVLVESDDGASLRSYDCKQLPEAFLWRVIGRYSSAKTQTPLEYNPGDYGTIGGGGGFNTGNALETDPLLRAPTIRFGTLRYQKAITKDLDGKATTASNGQRFDPPVMADRTYIVLSIERNEAVTNVGGGIPIFDPDTILDYENKVNSSNWAIQHPLIQGGVTWPIAAGLAKCESITAESQVEQNKIFWRVGYVFHINPNKKKNPSVACGGDNQLVFEGWQPEYLDVGTYQWYLGTGPQLFKKPIIDQFSKMPVTSPVPLDGTGKELQPTNAAFPPTFCYKYQSFRTFDSADFNLLGLP